MPRKLLSSAHCESGQTSRIASQMWLFKTSISNTRFQPRDGQARCDKGTPVANVYRPWEGGMEMGSPDVQDVKSILDFLW